MNDLVQLTRELQAPDAVSKTLMQKMSVFFDEANKQADVIDAIVVDSPDQKAEMQQAREIRLQIKNKRIEARDIVKVEREKLKNAMADFTLQDKLWLKSFQMLEAVCDNLEGKCEEKEKFAERWEAEQKQLKYEDRVKKLFPYGIDPSIYNLADMTDEAFDRLLQNEKLAYEARIKAEAEAEAKRIADAKVEAEARAKEEAQKAKLLAPDKEKLIDLAASFEMLPLPAVQSKEAMAVIRATQEMIKKMSGYIREKAQTL